MNKTGVERIFDGGISYRNQIHVKKDKYKFFKFLLFFSFMLCLIFVFSYFISPLFINGLADLLGLLFIMIVYFK